MALFRPRNVAATGVLGTTAWWVLDTRRLYREYPILPMKDYHESPGIKSAQPDVDAVEVVYARVRPPASVPRPIDAYEKAFFSTWAMRLQSVVFDKIGLTTPRPPNADPIDKRFPTQYLGSFFPVIHRDVNALLVAFLMPPVGDQPPGGGTQLLTAVEVDDELELSYANFGLAPPAPPEPAFIVPFHRWYMRFLIDRAKTKMVKEWGRK